MDNNNFDNNMNGQENPYQQGNPYQNNSYQSGQDMSYAYELKRQQELENKKGLAVGSLVCGVIAVTLCCCIGWLPGVIAIILGVVSLVKKRGGKGMAIGGIVTGAIGFVFGLIMIVFVAVPYMAMAPYLEKAMEGIDTSDPDAPKILLERIADMYYEEEGEYPDFYYEYHMDRENWYEDLMNQTNNAVEGDSVAWEYVSNNM